MARPAVRLTPQNGTTGAVRVTPAPVAPDLEQAFLEGLEAHPDCLPPGARVVVAVSGGCDSMVLLELLVRLRPDLALHVAHFDHGLRASSGSDAALVARRAEALAVPCSIGRPTTSLAGGAHDLFRAHRYAWLLGEAGRLDATRLATGHHADDQAETVLLRMLRGTGLRGLGAIPRRRGSIVRPLLDLRRTEIERYARRRGLEFSVDPSNVDPRWTRSRVRGSLLPELEDALDGSVRDRLVSLAAAARAADAALSAGAEELLRSCRRDEATPRVRLDRDRLRAAPKVLRSAALRRTAAESGVSLTRGATDAAVRFVDEARSGSAIDIGGGLILSREYGDVLLALPETIAPDRPVVIGDRSNGADRLVLGGKAFDARWWDDDDPNVGAQIALPPGWRHFPLSIRARQPGDRMRLSGGTRSLKRLYSDRRIPCSDRPTVPVLVDGLGRILWVAGVATDARLQGVNCGGDRWVLTIEEAKA